MLKMFVIILMLISISGIQGKAGNEKKAFVFEFRFQATDNTGKKKSVRSDLPTAIKVHVLGELISLTTDRGKNLCFDGKSVCLESGRYKKHLLRYFYTDIDILGMVPGLEWALPYQNDLSAAIIKKAKPSETGWEIELSKASAPPRIPSIGMGFTPARLVRLSPGHDGKIEKFGRYTCDSCPPEHLVKYGYSKTGSVAFILVTEREKTVGKYVLKSSETERRYPGVPADFLIEDVKPMDSAFYSSPDGEFGAGSKYFNMGRAFMREKRIDDAIAALKKAWSHHIGHGRIGAELLSAFRTKNSQKECAEFLAEYDGELRKTLNNKEIDHRWLQQAKDFIESGSGRDDRREKSEYGFYMTTQTQNNAARPPTKTVTGNLKSPLPSTSVGDASGRTGGRNNKPSETNTDNSAGNFTGWNEQNQDAGTSTRKTQIQKGYADIAKALRASGYNELAERYERLVAEYGDK